MKKKKKNEEETVYLPFSVLSPLLVIGNVSM